MYIRTALVRNYRGWVDRKSGRPVHLFYGTIESIDGFENAESQQDDEGLPACRTDAMIRLCVLIDDSQAREWTYRSDIERQANKYWIIIAFQTFLACDLNVDLINRLYLCWKWWRFNFCEWQFERKRVFVIRGLASLVYVCPVMVSGGWSICGGPRCGPRCGIIFRVSILEHTLTLSLSRQWSMVR